MTPRPSAQSIISASSKNDAFLQLFQTRLAAVSDILALKDTMALSELRCLNRAAADALRGIRWLHGRAHGALSVLTPPPPQQMSTLTTGTRIEHSHNNLEHSQCKPEMSTHSQNMHVQSLMTIRITARESVLRSSIPAAAVAID